MNFYLKMVALLMFCVVTGCKNEGELRPELAHNMNSLKELRGLLFLYSKKFDSYPDSIEQLLKEPYISNIRTTQEDLKFLCDDGKFLDWVYKRENTLEERKIITISSPESNSGKWLTLDLAGDIKVHDKALLRRNE